MQQEVGLALLQNISLYAGSHAELLQGGILARITPFLSGICNAHVFMRGKACAVLQHLSANPDNARDLLRVGAVGLLTLTLTLTLTFCAWARWASSRAS